LRDGAGSTNIGISTRVASTREATMARKYIDCREFPSEMNCSLAMSANSEKELLEAAVQHAVAVHQHKDTSELRQQLSKMFKNGSPPA
jgi:predicted small metal-binding protein